MRNGHVIHGLDMGSIQGTPHTHKRETVQLDNLLSPQVKAQPSATYLADASLRFRGSFVHTLYNEYTFNVALRIALYILRTCLPR